MRRQVVITYHAGRIIDVPSASLLFDFSPVFKNSGQRVPRNAPYHTIRTQAMKCFDASLGRSVGFLLSWLSLAMFLASYVLMVTYVWTTRAQDVCALGNESMSPLSVNEAHANDSAQ